MSEEITRWRKKPVEVEARQLIDNLRNHTAVATWITVNGGAVDVPFAEPCLFIETLEGRMRADIGDWIIRGVKGEFYPCKPDIFAATYEDAGSAAPDYRALLDKATAAHHNVGLPGEQKIANAHRREGGLEEL